MIEYDIEKEAKRVIEFYPKDSIASEFAQHILNLNIPPNYKYSFGIYTHKLKESNTPIFTHALSIDELPKHSYGAENYEIPIKDWNIVTRPHPSLPEVIVKYYWKK